MICTGCDCRCLLSSEMFQHCKCPTKAKVINTNSPTLIQNAEHEPLEFDWEIED